MQASMGSIAKEYSLNENTEHGNQKNRNLLNKTALCVMLGNSGFAPFDPFKHEPKRFRSFVL